MKLKNKLPCYCIYKYLYIFNDCYLPNYDTNIFSGDVKLNHAEDSGNKNQLSSLQAQKHLALKKNCPVMLIVNV